MNGALASRRALAGPLGEFRLPAGTQSWAALMASLSPAGWWRLGETSGAFADSSGNGHVGTLNGSTITRGVTGLITGDSNAAISNNGGASWIDCAIQPDRTKDLTAVCWVNMNSSAANKFAVSQKAGTGIGRNWLGVTATTNLAFSSLNGVGTLSGGSSLVGGKHMLTVTVAAATSTVTVYADGVSVASGTGSADTSTGDLIIGCNNAGAGGGALNGVLDEVAYWTSLLTPTQISNLYNAGK